MPYAEPASPVSPVNSSGFSSLLHSPRADAHSSGHGLNMTQLGRMDAQKALHRALQHVEGQRSTVDVDDDRVETIKDDESSSVAEGSGQDGGSTSSRPGWSRRHHYSGSFSGSSNHSGPSTPTGPTILPRRSTSSRTGSKQTSPLATPMSFEATSPLASSSSTPSLPKRASGIIPMALPNSSGQFQSGIDRRGKKGDGLGLRGVSRQVRDSQSSVSTMDSNGPPTPMDEITLSLQRYAAEQEAAEKRKRFTRGRTTSQDLDVSVDNDDASTIRPEGLPRRRSIERSQSRERIPDSAGLPSPAKEKESVIPFPRSTTAEQVSPAFIPTPASPLKSNVVVHRVINPRHTTRSGPSLGLRRQPSSSLQLDIPSTPPVVIQDMTMESGQSTPYASTYEGSRPTSSMIRKKSGELVKPSLKARSLSTPHLPLRGDLMGSKSEPATPAPDDRDYGSDRHKNVRFAGSSGDQGARLESVVLFLREQKVTAVSKTADGEEGMYPPTETETEADTDAREYAAFRRKRHAALQSQDDAEKFAFAEGSSVVPKLRLDFSSSAAESLKDHNVVLERVEMPSAAEPVALRGTVLVRNLAFQKWVAVRFTLDEWQTVSEVSGIHVSHLPSATTGDEGWDRFTFSIKLDDFKRKLEEKRLVMCVRFSIEGKEWWDSGVEGGNYNFAFKRYKPVRRQRAMFEVGGDAESPPIRQVPLTTPPIPGMRASSFGRATGWNFPGMGSPNSSPSKGVLGQSNVVSPPVNAEPSPDTPAFRKAATAFQVPPPPDIHEHLSLKGYCAPTSPMSPPKESTPLIRTPTKDDVEAPRGRTLSMIPTEKPSSLAPPDTRTKGHERRRSWGGEIVDDDQPAWIQTTSESPPVLSDQGNTKSRSKVDFHKVDPEAPLSPAVSGLDLLTPPSSALSTPPLGNSLHVTPESPSTDSASPSVTPSPPQAMADLPEVVVDGNERDRHLEDRAQLMQAEDNSGIHSPGYKEFVEKFCFFQSRAATAASPVQSRCTTPTGMPPAHRTFNPFGPEYANLATSSQHNTPTGHGFGGDNYFSFQPASSTYGRLSSGSSSSGSASGNNTPNFSGRPNAAINFVTSH